MKTAASSRTLRYAASASPCWTNVGGGFEEQDETTGRGSSDADGVQTVGLDADPRYCDWLSFSGGTSFCCSPASALISRQMRRTVSSMDMPPGGAIGV